MLKKIIRKNNQDFLHQYQWISPLSKIKIVQSTVQTSDSRAIKRQKSILPLQFYLNLFLNQKPQIKIAKESDASFKIRPNMILGTKNHLHNSQLNEFFPYFICSILPTIKKYPKITINPLLNNSYDILISYGWKEIVPYNIPHTVGQLGGAHVQFLIKSPVPKLPFLFFTVK